MKSGGVNRVLALLAGAVLALFALLRFPEYTWLRLEGTGPLPAFSLLNPFRNRAPERTAEACLAQVAREARGGALRELPGGEEADPSALELERAMPLRGWRLVRAQRRGPGYTYQYRVERDHVDGALPVWVDVEPREGGYRVSLYAPGFQLPQ